jgi:D-amino-acid oxidase
VIGAGIVGLAVAWLLSRRGHPVLLIDPAASPSSSNLRSGSGAALGMLMAQVYRRSSGRGWRLRQQSLALWQQWRAELGERGHAIPFRPGLLQLAGSADEREAQRRLVEQRQRQGLPLQWLEPEALQGLRPQLPPAALGGVLSPNDGQLDPMAAMAALRADATAAGLEAWPVAVDRISRGDAQQRRWLVHGADGRSRPCRWLVVCAGLGSAALVEPLGHDRPQSPVLGQALELQLPSRCDAEGFGAAGWPGSLSWGGINLVPRPGGRLWLGATLEPGEAADPAQGAQLQQLGGQAPEWLRQATVLEQWQGLRARPLGRPAPLLEALEPGLLLASGHYRNGVLLAPASAAWVADHIAQG